MAVRVATVAVPTSPREGMFGFALGALAIAFLIYITAKGELSTYVGFFLFTPASGASSASPSASGPSLAPSPSTDAASPSTGGVNGVGASPGD